MPSIKVTETKGLFQKKATLAEPAGSLHGFKRVSVEKTDNCTLTVEESGKIIHLNKGSAITVTLPGCAAAKGCHYTIVSDVNQNHVITEDAAIDTNVLTLIDVNATATARGHAFTTATLTGGDIGDRIHIFSDGTFWVLTAFTKDGVTAA